MNSSYVSPAKGHVIARVLLRDAPVFRGAPPGLAADVNALFSTGARRVARPGEFVYRRGVIPKTLLVVTSGFVEVRRSGLMLRRLGLYELIGVTSVVSETPHSADIVGAGDRDAELFEVDGAAFRALVEKHPVLHRALVARLAQLISDLTDDIELALGPVVRRVARALLTESESGTVLLGWTQEALAARCWTDKYMVNRALSALRDEGIRVQSVRGHIEVRNRAQLTRYVAQSAGVAEAKTG